MKTRIGIPLFQVELNGNTGWIAGFYFIKNCLNALATLPPEEIPEIYVFVKDDLKEPLLLPEHANNAAWLKVIHIPEEMFTEKNRHDNIEHYINAHNCQLFFPFITTPSFNVNSAWLGWIPDFQDRHLPQFFSEHERRIRKLTYDFIIGYCEKIFCSSQSVYTDLKTFYPECKNKGVVVSFSSVLPADCLTTNPKAVLNRHGITQKYIYLPNQFWVHKNHKLVFEAWRELKHNGHNYLLVCTGSSEDYRFPNHYQELQTFLIENNLTDTVRILGFIDRDEQIQLYRGASAILQPSLFEGWSTSLEDAKALGKTLIASDIPVHHEQCKEQAYYFDSTKPEALAKLIQKIWGSLPTGYEPHREQQAVSTSQAKIRTFARNLIKVFDSFATVNLADIKSKNLLLSLLIELNIDRAARLQQLKESESDREARLNVINKQQKMLDELQSKIIHMNYRLQEQKTS